MNSKKYSCTALQSSVYFAPDELRHCCKRFFFKGKMKGDVKIFKVKKKQKVVIDPKKIIDSKKKLIDQINNSKDENPCTGCPHLIKDEWGNLDETKIKHISIEAHSVCQMKCTYCSEVYYGGKDTNYNLLGSIENLYSKNLIDKNVDLAWGGGEPVLLKDFDKIFPIITDKLKPFGNMIYSNAIKYNSNIEKYLKENKAKLTTSIDAGNVETFKKVRGVKAFNKVFSNLSKYYKSAKKNIIIKYILTRKNSDFKNLEGFINKIKEYNLVNCEFQISYDFKEKNIPKKHFYNAVNLYFELKKLSNNNCFFDYHLKPKIQNMLKKSISNKEEEIIELINNLESIKKLQGNKIIIWGAGDTGRELIKNSFFLKFKKLTIDYFVDKFKFNSTMSNKFEIKHPENILNNDKPILIASSAYNQEIYNEIISMGIKKERIIDNIFL